MDRFVATDCFSDEQWRTEAAGNRCPSWVRHQGAPGRGALCRLVSIELGVHDLGVLTTETFF